MAANTICSDLVTSFKRSHACTATISTANQSISHCRPAPQLDTPGQIWVSLLWGHCSFLLGPGTHKVLFAFPVLCKFWRLYGEVNGDLLQKGLCHIQVYCTQSLCPCSSPVLTCASAGDTQTQFCLSLWVLVHTRYA